MTERMKGHHDINWFSKLGRRLKSLEIRCQSIDRAADKTVA